MKRYIVFGVLIFLIAVGTLPVWSSGKGEENPGEQQPVYVIAHPDIGHEQVLGGRSTHASRGLAVAQQRARFMELRTPEDSPADKPKDHGDNGGNGVRKKKK